MTTLMACGDVGVKRPDCPSMFAGCAEILQQADLCFAQLETTISERGAPVPNAKLAMRAPPAMASAAKTAGIDVVSFAGNHCLDYGYDAFADTLKYAADAGLAVCGAGKDLEAARRPALIDAAGSKVAVFAASSILPEGYAAETERAGCAPLRAHTAYEQIEPDQPGTAARIRTFADRDDLEALLEGIRAARERAHIVLLSVHWGIHMVPTSIADYQIEIAHRAIDAGADAILGHHPHLLKGVEFYRGRPIFYSLGNFAIEQPHIWNPAIVRSASFKHLVSLNPQWTLDSTYMLPAVTRMTGIAKLVRNGGEEWQVRFIPAWIGDDSVPSVLFSNDSRFADVAAFISSSTQLAGFTTQISIDGDELLLRPRHQH
ncbi:MAG TPA: CapA family protein [Steroidobacteraceae bacterium]|jgi:poly-gamma-glutamate capsule biosynthesis protein CapA/YwtB (metallophosphatase superfamily)|nr:CapA family protein [Steroidobacteraceae bacterium]